MKKEDGRVVDDLPDGKERVDAAYSYIRIAEKFRTNDAEMKTLIMGVAAILGLMISLVQQKEDE